MAKTMHEGLLLTGFETFSNFKRNISQQVVELISAEEVFDFKISTTILAVDETGSREVSDRIESGEKFDTILHLGFSENANEILLERYARNNFHMKIADNSGRLLTSGKISPGHAILETKVPRNFIDNYLTGYSKIRWNEDAGGFVCNETYYRSLLASSEMHQPVVLFIHLPSEKILSLKEQSGIITLICKSLNQMHYTG
jgi:pyrrolidone-carboxylate peptidase